MFIQTYLKFYQEYLKMVCSTWKGISRHISWHEKLPIGPFSQIRSHLMLQIQQIQENNLYRTKKVSEKEA